MKQDKTALLVVDVQTALTTQHPFEEEEVIARIACLMEAAREAGTEVLYVRHQEEGDLEAGTPGWEIDARIAPTHGEKIFDKCHNSAFKDTGLGAYLEGKGIGTLIVVGMQTEYCIDTTLKVAFELGYQVFVPEGCTTTYDNEFLSAQRLRQYYEQDIWEGGFAQIIPMEYALTRLKEA